MNDVVEKYLNDLDRLLSKRINEPRCSELVAEVRAHLSLAVKDLGTGAEQQAINELGSARMVAQELIRQETGMSIKPAWKLVRVSLLFLILALALDLGVLFQQPTFGTMKLTMWSQGLFIVSLVGFGIVVFKSRRWLVVPYLAIFLGTSIAAALLLTGFWTGAIGSSRSIGGISGRASLISGQATTLASLHRDLEYAGRAQHAIQSGQPLPKQGAYFLRP